MACGGGGHSGDDGHDDDDGSAETVVILQTLYTGENLNDLRWHTVYIQRRGNEMEVWVDDEPHTTGNTPTPPQP